MKVKFALGRLALPLSRLAQPQAIIVAAFAGSCIYLVASCLYPWVALRKVILPPIERQRTARIKTASQPKAKPLEFYLENIKAGSLFGRPQAIKGAAAMVNTDLTKEMSLVGIISGENPQAVIQDKKTESVYYLNKGQFIGDFEVQDIQEGKVSLNYKGQIFELHL